MNKLPDLSSSPKVCDQLAGVEGRACTFMFPILLRVSAKVRGSRVPYGDSAGTLWRRHKCKLAPGPGGKSLRFCKQ